MVSHLTKGVPIVAVWSRHEAPPLDVQYDWSRPLVSVTPLAEAPLWSSRLGLAAVSHPRGSESACRGEAGELVHLDPEAPP